MWLLKISSFWRRFPVTERRARHHPTTSSSLRASSEGVSSRFPWWNMVNHAAPPKKMWQQNETNMETNTSKIVTIVLKLNDIEFIDDGSCSNYVQLIKSKVRRPKNSEGLQFFFCAFHPPQRWTPRQRAMLSAVSWWTGPKSTTCRVKVGRLSDFLKLVFCRYDHWISLICADPNLCKPFWKLM